MPDYYNGTEVVTASLSSRKKTMTLKNSLVIGISFMALVGGTPNHVVSSSTTSGYISLPSISAVSAGSEVYKVKPLYKTNIKRLKKAHRFNKNAMDRGTTEEYNKYIQKEYEEMSIVRSRANGYKESIIEG